MLNPFTAEKAACEGEPPQKDLCELEQDFVYHERLGSTPPDILRENPGKRRSDLMTDDEISVYLGKQQARIKRYEEIIAADPSEEASVIGDFLKAMRKNEKLTQEYLKRIGKLPAPETAEQEFTYEEIKTLLGELEGVFRTLRSEQQVPRTFFDPASGYIAEYDESPVGTVLTMYRAAIIDEDPVVTRNLHTDADRQAVIGALEPRGRERAVLFAYYQVNETDPWSGVSGHFSSRQSYKSENFPTPSTIWETLKRVKDNAEETNDIL